MTVTIPVSQIHGYEMSTDPGPGEYPNTHITVRTTLLLAMLKIITAMIHLSTSHDRCVN